MAIMARLAQCGLVHCDFNEFNLLISDHEAVTLIDFPQMVSVAHRNAELFFDRDVDCLKRFFVRKYNFRPEEEAIPDPIFRQLAGHDGALDTMLRASGFGVREQGELEAALEEAREAVEAEAAAAPLGAIGEEGGEEGEEEEEDEEDEEEVEEVEEEEEEEELLERVRGCPSNALLCACTTPAAHRPRRADRESAGQGQDAQSGREEGGDDEASAADRGGDAQWELAALARAEAALAAGPGSAAESTLFSRQPGEDRPAPRARGGRSAAGSAVGSAAGYGAGDAESDFGDSASVAGSETPSMAGLSPMERAVRERAKAERRKEAARAVAQSLRRVNYSKEKSGNRKARGGSSDSLF